MLGDVREGAHSLLEVQYPRNFERAHELPEGARNIPTSRGTSRLWRDVRYGKYATTVELDGRLGHIEEGRWRDMRRDNATTVACDATLRYGYADVAERTCLVAEQVASVLRDRGWTGQPRPCGPACRLLPMIIKDAGRRNDHDAS